MERVDESIEELPLFHFWVATLFVPHQTLATHIAVGFVLEDETFVRSISPTHNDFYFFKNFIIRMAVAGVADAYK